MEKKMQMMLVLRIENAPFRHPQESLCVLSEHADGIVEPKGCGLQLQVFTRAIPLSDWTFHYRAQAKIIILQPPHVIICICNAVSLLRLTVGLWLTASCGGSGV